MGAANAGKTAAAAGIESAGGAAYGPICYLLCCGGKTVHNPFYD